MPLPVVVPEDEYTSIRIFRCCCRNPKTKNGFFRGFAFLVDFFTVFRIHDWSKLLSRSASSSSHLCLAHSIKLIRNRWRHFKRCTARKRRETVIKIFRNTKHGCK
ncbi:hypothetical protein BT96DRAFT_469616 [Gymnopus androsaceus JB14]|uniref:Uncharacterized protein n=1 Tax=Gymnopus androsaceus JB14 TaxID=1447944 RepID=A0A6A4IP94_9AGAR|nr:hypothetical protein BT96DRAFT_469616 [Gymnopus androsaceus JB14]